VTLRQRPGAGNAEQNKEYLAALEAEVSRQMEHVNQSTKTAGASSYVCSDVEYLSVCWCRGREMGFGHVEERHVSISEKTKMNLSSIRRLSGCVFS